MSSKIFLGAALALTVALIDTQGASISNGDFETGGAVGGTGFTSSVPTGWSNGTGASGTAGLLNNDQFSLVTSNSPANIAYLTGDRSFTQTIGETVADNLSLQLTFKVGVRNSGGTPLPTDFEAGLYTTGGTELQKATIAQVAGGTLTSDLKTVSIQFDAGVGHGQNGQAIEVRLISTTGNTGSQTIFDDVTISVVPEPTTYALVSGLGLLGMAAYRRHKLRQA